MDIQVWFDVVCPWCYIARRRLEKALTDFPADATVTWRAFQLEPSPTPRGVLVKDAVVAKLGGRERTEQRLAYVTALAATEGLTLDFDRAVDANTFDSHRLIFWAAPQGRQADMLDALQRAHFAEGVDLGSRPALAGVASGIGLDRNAALAYLESEAGVDAVKADLIEARDLGITSVPTFVIEGKYALQGVQESATLLAALEEIARREAVDTGR